jgi:hypothetical protein
MRTALTFLLVSAGAFALAEESRVSQPPASPPPVGNVEPSSDFDDAAALVELRAAIAGREREPAGSVFRNVQIHRERPAVAILGIMEIGYARSLGVHCTHCHDPSDWSSDAKPAKQIAREMHAMVRRINDELLAPIDGLRSERPVVNCTTCHRGQVTPALDLAP